MQGPYFLIVLRKRWLCSIWNNVLLFNIDSFFNNIIIRKYNFLIIH